MKFKKLNLYTIRLETEWHFYSEVLGFEILERSANSFSVKVGWSELTFTRSDEQHIYHYCFLIPDNMLDQAIEWLEKRIELLDIKNGRKIQNFESWNADSLYFYDASGNIAEFIVRYDLNFKATGEFDTSKVIGVNEIGMPTDNIEKSSHQLSIELRTEFWKGDLERFGTHGTQEGIFLLPNYHVKDIWYPTQIKIRQEPFEAVIESGGKEHLIEFRNGKIRTSPTSG